MADGASCVLNGPDRKLVLMLGSRGLPVLVVYLTEESLRFPADWSRCRTIADHAPQRLFRLFVVFASFQDAAGDKRRGKLTIMILGRPCGFASLQVIRFGQVELTFANGNQGKGVQGLGDRSSVAVMLGQLEGPVRFPFRRIVITKIIMGRTDVG